MFKKFTKFFSSSDKKIKEQEDLLKQALSSNCPRKNDILACAKNLLELGVSKADVASMLSGHTDLFEVMEFTMSLEPRFAEKFAEASLSSAMMHVQLCGHPDRAHFARNSVQFAARCYDRAGSYPYNFRAIYDSILSKTAWIV